MTRSRQNDQTESHSLEPLIDKLCICRLHALKRAVADICLRYLFSSWDCSYHFEHITVALKIRWGFEFETMHNVTTLTCVGRNNGCDRNSHFGLPFTDIIAHIRSTRCAVQYAQSLIWSQYMIMWRLFKLSFSRNTLSLIIVFSFLKISLTFRWRCIFLAEWTIY